MTKKLKEFHKNDERKVRSLSENLKRAKKIIHSFDFFSFDYKEQF